MAFEHGARFEGCPGTSVEHASRHHRRLIQPATVRLPSIRADTRAGTPRDNARFRRAPVQPRMRSMAVIVALEIEELHLQTAAVQNSVRSKHSRRIVPISRSTKGCESGTYDTVLISLISSMRRFAYHR
jgi:hypothetical protein